MKIAFEQRLEVESIDDDGQAIIACLTQIDGLHCSHFLPRSLFVRLQSWDEARQHEDMYKFIGKRVRVTVEVIEEDGDGTEGGCPESS